MQPIPLVLWPYILFSDIWPLKGSTLKTKHSNDIAVFLFSAALLPGSVCVLVSLLSETFNVDIVLTIPV